MSCEQCKSKETRTDQQNRSLHLFYKQLSNECMEKGIEMRELVRDEVPIPATPENIKWMWKLLQKAMFGTTSTRELKKTGQIEQLYDVFSKIFAERTGGEVQLPPWPSMESLINES